MNPRASAPHSIAAKASSGLVTPQILTYGDEPVLPLKKRGTRSAFDVLLEEFKEFKELQEFKEI